MTTDKIYYYSLLGIAILLPSPFYGGVLALLSVSAVCVLAQKEYKSFLRSLKDPVIFLPALLYLYIFVGFFFSYHVRIAFTTLSTMLPLILFPFFIGSATNISAKIALRINLFFLASVTLTLLFAIIYNAINIMITGIAEIRIADAYYHKLKSFGLTDVYYNYHPSYASAFVNLGIAIVLELCFTRKHEMSRSKKLLLFCTGIFLSACVFLLNSVTGIIALLALLLFYTVKWVKQSVMVNTTAKWLTIAILCALPFFFVYLNPLGNDKIASLQNKPFVITDEQSERNILTIRMAKWETYYHVFKSYPVWGTTLGDIPALRKKEYLRVGFHDLALNNYNAHNQYLEILVPLGLVGFMFFMATLFIPFTKKNLYGLYAPFLLVSLLFFCTESMLHRQQGILLFMFFYSLYTHRNLTERP